MYCTAFRCDKSEKEPGWMDCGLPAGTGSYADTFGDCALLYCDLLMEGPGIRISHIQSRYRALEKVGARDDM